MRERERGTRFGQITARTIATVYIYNVKQLSVQNIKKSQQQQQQQQNWQSKAKKAKVANKKKTSKKNW